MEICCSFTKRRVIRDTNYKYYYSFGSLKAQVRVKAQLADLSQLEMKFLYEDGGTCDSHFHLYNKYSGGHYVTGISLDLTASYDPWVVEVNTTLGYGISDLMINVGAPVLSSPFQAHLSYELTNTIFEFEAQIGVADGETAAVTFSGQRESGWDSVQRSGSLMVDTPWTEPLILNVTNYQESDLIHVSVDLTTAIGGIQSVRSDFGIYYTKPGETLLQFNATHEQLAIGLELNNKHSGKGYTQQLKGTVNDIEITYALETEWDHSLIPETADGQIAISNLLDHNLNLTVSHNRNSSTFATKIFGSWGDQLLKASHILEFQNQLDWSSLLDVVLPSKEEIKSELSLSAADFTTFQSNLNFTSPWTDDIVTVVTAVPNDSSITYELTSIHRDSVLSRASLRSNRVFGWDHSDFKLEVSSSYLENCSIAWEHGMDYGSLVSMEVTYGSDFLIQATSNLTFNQGWFSQEFSEYLLLAEVRAPEQGINFKTNLMFDSQYNGNLEALWGDSSLMAKSAIFNGVIFKTLVDIPGHKYQADLEYTEGVSEIPDFDFTLAIQDEDVLIVNTTTTSLYPILDVQLTFQVLADPGAQMQTGLVNVTMDLSQVEDFTFLGSVKFLSDFAGFENYGLHVETNVNLDYNKWDVGFDIKLYANTVTYNLNMSGSLALNDLPHLKYKMAYGMDFNDHLLDQKEVNFMFGIHQYGSYQTNVTLVLGNNIPQWAMFMSYNDTGKDIKGYVIPGDDNKYEVAASLNGDNLVFNSQRVADDGSTFIAAEGKITWDVNNPRKQITLTMNSDIEAIKEVSGDILITESRGFEVNANFMLNQQKFISNLRHEARGSGNSGRAVLVAENTIFLEFKFEANFEFFFTDEEFKADLKINVNDDGYFIKSHMKASLEESYIRIEMPIEDWENIDLTVNIMTDESYRVVIKMKVPKFCFNFDGKLDQLFLHASVNINILENCSATAIFEFNMKYEVKDNLITVFSDCYIQGIGLFFTIEGECKIAVGEYDVVIKGEFYPEYSLGLEFSWLFKEDEFGLKLHVYEISTDTTYFLFNSNFSFLRSEITFKVLEEQKLELKAEYDIQPTQIILEASYDYSLFGQSLAGKLTGEASFKETFGDIEILFSTDSAFGQANLEVGYDFRNEVKMGHLRLTTSNGDADGKLQLQTNDQGLRLTFDMSSSLHSFQKYHFDAHFENKINGNTLNIYSSQDDMKYNFTSSVSATEDGFMGGITFHMPFEILEMFEVDFSLPLSEVSERKYVAMVSGVTAGEYYGLGVKHSHQENWKQQKTELNFITPAKTVSNFTAFIEYDFDGKAALYVNGTRGCLGLDTNWQNSDVLFAFEVHSYLTLLGLGEHIVSVDIPLDFSQRGEFRITAQKTNYDFATALIIGENFKYGNVTFMILPEAEEPVKRVYDLNYEYNNQFYLNGQFDEWKVSTRWDFTGDQISALSGNVKIQTNFPEYELINGYWDIHQKDSIYSLQFKFDMKQKGIIFLSSGFDNHPRGSSAPWRGIKLDLLFDSPFTLTHTLRAQYHANPLKVSATYKHGFDTFQVDFTTNFQNNEGTVGLTGNIPVPGISVFKVDLKYKFSDKSQNVVKFKAKIEETNLEVNGKAKMDWSNGIIEATAVSPFFSPGRAEFTWSTEKTRVTYWAMLEYKQQEIKVKMALEQTSRLVKLDIFVSTPFEGWKNIKVHIGYSWLPSAFTFTSVLTKEKMQIYNIKSSFLFSKEKVAFSIEGSFEPLKTSGLLIFEFTSTENAYEIKFQEQLNEYKVLEFHFEFDEYHLECELKYGSLKILEMIFDYYKAEVFFTWDKGQYLNVKVIHPSPSNALEINFLLKISDNRPVSVQITHTLGQNVSMILAFGERKYTLTGKMNVDNRKLLISIIFESSEDVDNPITIEAMFDLTDFVRGKMKAVKEIAKISLDWGGKIELSLSGLRQKNAIKIALDLTTPYEILPKLHLSFEVGQKRKQNSLEVNYELSCEWSEKIEVSGSLKYKSDDFLLKNEVQTTFPIVEKLDSKLLLKPKYFEITTDLNGDEWKLSIREYSFSLPFSLKVDIKTPLEGYESLSLMSSVKLKNGELDSEITFNWPEEKVITLKIQAEMWNLKVKLNTPWTPLREVIFIASLRTESEEVSSKVTLQWDGSKVEMTSDMTPKEAQIVGKYNNGQTEVASVRLEYINKGNNLEFGVVVETIYDILKLFRTNFQLGPQGISLEVLINDVMSRFKGSYSEGAIKFILDIPFLYDFQWNLEAKQDWTKLDTYSTMTYPKGTTPYNITLNYALQTSSLMVMFDIDGDEKIMSLGIDVSDTWKFVIVYFGSQIETTINPNVNDVMSLRFESTDFNLEVVTVNISVDYGEFVNVSSIVTTDFRNMNVSSHVMNISYTMQKESFVFGTVLTSSYIDGSYKLDTIIPMRNILVEKGKAVLSLFVGEQKYIVSYVNDNPVDMASNRNLRIEFPEWTADFSTEVTEDSFTMVFSYPGPSTKHELAIMWPETSGAENILLTAELNSPYLGEDPAKFNLKFVVLDELHFTFDSEFSHGTKQIDMEGELRYNDNLKELIYNTKIRSDWIGDYSVDVNVHWIMNIVLDATLKIYGEKHNFNLKIDPDIHEASAKASSSWIPYRNMEFMGSLGKDLTPSNMDIKGKLSLGDGEILVEGRFQNDGIESLKAHLNMTHNMNEIFKAVLDFDSSVYVTSLNFTVTSIVPEMNTVLTAQYENYGSKQVRVDVQGFLAIYNELNLYIRIGDNWYNSLKVYFSIQHLFSLEYHLSTDPDFLTSFRFESDNTVIHANADYNVSYDNLFSMTIDHSLLPLEFVQVHIPWPLLLEDTQIHISFVYDAEFTMFEASRNVDWDCLVTVITPFKSYEKFVFKFLLPRGDLAFVAMIEHPGGKLGVEAVYRSFYSTKLVVSLPLEKYDIIAFQYNIVDGNHRIVEARVGKVGFTVSFQILPQNPFTCIEMVLRLNEMSVQGYVIDRHSSKRYGIELHLEFESIDILSIHTLDMQLVRVVNEMDIFILKTDLEELIKLQIAKGKENIFALTTPKSFPVFLVVNLQNSGKVNECRMKVGVSLGPDPDFENYGFHIRQESLEGGHHISLSGDAAENSFYAEGTLSLNYYHFNESLIFELNKNRLGYRSTFEAHPGILKDEYNGNIEVMLPGQTLHWNMFALCGSKDVALQSKFTWNELAEEVGAMNFMVNYNDNTIFGQGEHHMKIVFMHPDIKDIIFEGNITQYEDFTVSGMAEFLDKNIPEMNITLAFDMYPVMDDGKQHFTGNISQLSSGLLAVIDTKVMNTPSVRLGDYSVKYWSLTKESWEELHLSTALNTTEEAYDFALDISTSDDDWGYAYRGGIYSWDESGAFLLGGSSKKYQDFWEIESKINKYLPEFKLQLGVGQGEQEPYEQGRLRIGLHNPLEMGAVLDHRKFGEWRQDGTVGLRLKAKNVLQFVLEYDPSMDSMDDYFLKNLISPADRISGMWWRDLRATPQAVQEWVLAEGPTAIEVLVNKPILFKLLEKEGEKLQILISDIDATLTEISLLATTIWTEDIKPSLDTTYSYGSAIYAQTSEALSGFVAILTEQVSDYGSQLALLVLEQWTKVEEGFWNIYIQCATWGAEVTTQMLEVLTRASDTLITAWTTCLEATQAVLSSVQAVSEPVFKVLFETFAKYIEDLGAVLGGQCVQELSTRFAEMVASLEQDVGGGASVILEFLQPEEYTRRLLLLRDGLAAWARDTAGALRDAAAQAGSSLGNSEAAHVVATFGRLLNDALGQIQHEGLRAYIQQRTADLRTTAATMVEEVLRVSKEGLETLGQSSLLRTSFLRPLHQAAESLYENVDTAWRKGRAGLERELEGVQKTLYLLGSKVQAYLERKNYFLNEILIYQPYDYGRIRYNQFLPVPWKSFLDSPDWAVLTRLFVKESPSAKAERLLELGMLELDSGWRPLPPPGVLVPLSTAPRLFTATATVMGQHVTTFDLHHYEFLGPCSYLLAKDFIDGDFEVIGVYESESGDVRLESVLIRAPGTDVTLHVDGTVDVIYAAAQMESADGRAELRTNDLEVICSREFQGCSITVTSKYFGRLGGMLGNFNYEPSDDQQGPDGTKVGSVGGLARLWAVSTQACYQANQATQVLALDGVTGVDECQRLFLGANSSPFVTCFSTVDPRPYFWHCVNDRNRPLQRQGASKRSCDAAESYRVMCATEGRPLPALDACLGRGTSEDQDGSQVSQPDSPTCSTPDGQVPVGWSRSFWGAKNGSLDVGLVVELASCNEGKDFGQMLKEVAKSFRKAGYEDVRFALMTYTSSELGSASAFSSEGRVAPQLEGVAMEDSKDAHGGSAAVMKAARTMQWRPGVGRVLLQASCQLCDDGESVAEALRENDVVLHVLSRLTVTLEGPETAESKTLAWRIFGYDKDLVYTSSDYRTFQGDAGQRELLEEHGESCLDTVQDAGGAVFNSNRWIPKKAGLTRKFLSVLSQRLATDVPEPRCHQCRCLADEDQARLSCRRCGEEPEINAVMEKIIEDFRAEFHTDESPLA
ncbi:uncharacterized protein LOC134771279 [Penaeus indicus]|uniref:uncharacterized protein LOC134771279 n=1 Tax=Penaeus indicus TaxID=29960 RepID=UPI00300D7069